MRFLLNVNVPRALGRRLKEAGHESRHTADVGMARQNDTAIMEEARSKNEVILTHDLDYGTLLAFVKFEATKPRAPSVVTPLF